MKTFFTMIGIFFLTLCISMLPHIVYAEQDQGCLDRAVNDRINEMKNAHDEYNDTVKRSAERLARDENEASRQQDFQFRASEIQRIRANYAQELRLASEKLNTRSAQIWSQYQGKTVSCGYSTVDDLRNTSNPINSAYGYMTYPQQSGFDRAVSIYPSYSSYYPSWNYGGYQPFTTSVPGLTYAPYTPWYQWYGYPYSSDFARYQTGLYYYNYCPVPVFPPLRDGCGYEQRRDGNGCISYDVSCRRLQGKSKQCLCPQYYMPICGADGKTYMNDCSLRCADISPQYYGQCR